VQRILRRLALSVALIFSGTFVSAQNATVQAEDIAIQAQVRSLPELGSNRIPYASFFGQRNTEHQAASQQPGGVISGTILDQTGAVSTGARVLLTGEDRSLKREVVSGNNGQFSFSNVPPGHFQLTVSSGGFANQAFSGVLSSGQTLLVPPIVLAVAVAETKVRVGVDTVEVAEAQLKEQQKQRVLGIIPNFYVSYVPDAAPLTAKQKFRLSWKVAKDPVTFVGVAALAGFQQAGDQPDYGQGMQGYAKRYGAAYADAFAGIFIGNALLPSLLKQDPRYFYKGTGSIRLRTLYAIVSPVVCKGDNKRWQPNYSGILGGLAVGGISNLYYPAADRNSAGVVFQNALIRLGQGSVGAIFQEFVLPKLTFRFKNRGLQPKTD
jgi:hypothetical protein